jgi:ankyrin repeat protein
MEPQSTDDSELFRDIMDVCINGDVRALLQLLVDDVTNEEQKETDKWQSFLDNVMQPVKMRPEIKVGTVFFLVLIIEKTVNFIDKESGNTPLHYAAARNKSMFV